MIIRKGINPKINPKALEYYSCNDKTWYTMKELEYRYQTHKETIRSAFNKNKTLEDLDIEYGIIAVSENTVLSTERADRCIINHTHCEKYKMCWLKNYPRFIECTGYIADTTERTAVGDCDLVPAKVHCHFISPS